MLSRHTNTTPLKPNEVEIDFTDYTIENAQFVLEKYQQDRDQFQTDYLEEQKNKASRSGQLGQELSPTLTKQSLLKYKTVSSPFELYFKNLVEISEKLQSFSTGKLNATTEEELKQKGRDSIEKNYQEMIVKLRDKQDHEVQNAMEIQNRRQKNSAAVEQARRNHVPSKANSIGFYVVSTFVVITDAIAILPAVESIGIEYIFAIIISVLLGIMAFTAADSLGQALAIEVTS